MAKSQKNIPEVRFPEFEKDGEWKISSVNKMIDNDLLYPPKDGNHGNIHPKSSDYVKSGIPFIMASDIKSGKIDFENCAYLRKEQADSLQKGFSKSGDVLLTHKGTVGEVAELGEIDFPYLMLTPQVTYYRIKNKSELLKGFLASSFRASFFQKKLKDVSGGGTRAYVGITEQRKFDLFLPENINEQQKIADCLSSLDELISAHKEKLEALKDHKKGLLQNLFPQEGQKVPNYRFPEFENDEEWEEKKLGNMTSKVGSGKTPRGGQKVYVEKGRPFVRSQNIGWGILLMKDIAFIDDETHSTFLSTEIEERDVLLNITGASIGRSAVADNSIVGGNVNQHVCIIRTTAKLIPSFLNQYLNSEFGQKQIDSFQAGGNREGLNFGQIRSFSIPVPPLVSEQQKITDCLSSLDDLISAQTDKIEQLQKHKKGLMQGLFPKGQV